MTPPSTESSSNPEQRLDVKLFVRVRIVRGDADLELNGKTGWISEDGLLVRVIPDTPDADRFAQPAGEVVAEICYSRDQRVILIEGIIAERDVRPGYLKLRLDVSTAHTRLLERWRKFVDRFGRYHGSRPTS